MPYGLQRFQQSQQSHFLTFSCYQRQPFLSDGTLRDLFLNSLELIRRRYRLRVFGYVVMPEHIHLLLSEPERASLATAIQALKVSVSRRAGVRGLHQDGAFWQKRYYDHNVHNYKSFAEKLRYIHRNPVKRGLCASPLDWNWSSYRHYATAEIGTVEIESQWTADRRLGRDAGLLNLQDQ
jgi:putative transposase